MLYSPLPNYKFVMTELSLQLPVSYHKGEMILLIVFYTGIRLYSAALARASATMRLARPTHAAKLGFGL